MLQRGLCPVCQSPGATTLLQQHLCHKAIEMGALPVGTLGISVPNTLLSSETDTGSGRTVPLFKRSLLVCGVMLYSVFLAEKTAASGASGCPGQSVQTTTGEELGKGSGHGITAGRFEFLINLCCPPASAINCMFQAGVRVQSWTHYGYRQPRTGKLCANQM